jgi:hypothetical protein
MHQIRLHVLVVPVALLCFGLSAHAEELENFKEIAQTTIDAINRGDIDNIDHLLAMQDQLIAIGTAVCADYAKRYPEDAEMLNLITSNAQQMKNMMLWEIKEQWHAKRYLLQQGIAVEKLQQNSRTGSLMDTVVHPATAYVALTQYKLTKDDQLLKQVDQELSEAIYQLAYIE